MDINEMKSEFLESYEKHFNSKVPDLLSCYDKHFIEHIKIINKLGISANYFYNKINEFIVKTNKRPLIYNYNEKLIIKIIKEEKTPIKSKFIDTNITIEKQNAIKKRFCFLWSTENIFKTHVFLYKCFTKNFLLQDIQFMELYNSNYDFQGFRDDIIEYIK